LKRAPVSFQKLKRGNVYITYFGRGRGDDNQNSQNRDICRGDARNSSGPPSFPGSLDQPTTDRETALWKCTIKLTEKGGPSTRSRALGTVNPDQEVKRVRKKF